MSKRQLLFLILLAPLTVMAQVTYQRQDSVTICRLLSKAPQQNCTLWLARQLIGRPYVAATLEVNDTEQLVVNTRQLDCTTLVETVTALTLCVQQGMRTWDGYLTMLRTLRYRQGVLDGYTSRLHYFSDWICDKEAMRIVKEIQEPQPPFTAVQHIKVDYMSKHPQNYQALRNHQELVKTIRQQEEALSGVCRRYIPKSEGRNTKVLRETVHDGDIIAITCNKPGLEIAHLGFAVWHKDGLHLLNASQLRKKVVEEPLTLRQYLRQHPTHTGIRIVRINKN